MNYKKISQLFAELSEEFAKLASNAEVAEKPTEAKEEKKAAPKKETKTAKTAGKKSEPEGDDDEATLKAMGFNELKKYAASKGVSATGKRDDIIARILNGAEETADEPEAEKKPADKKSKPAKKDNVVDFAEKKEENDKIEAQADDLLEANDLDDIISELKEVGMKGVTKKTARAKLIEALKKGLLDLDDDEDEDGSDASEDDADEAGDDADAGSDNDDDDDGEEIDENTYFEDFDDEDGANNPENVSEEARMSAMTELQGQILEDIESEELELDDMREFLSENSTEDEKEEISDLDDDSVIAAYIELRKRMIDDDGDDMSDEGDPYYVNGEIYAHGHKCPEVDGEYVDEVAGETFTLD